VDFYAPTADLVVEVDGAQHAETPQAEHDRERTAYLEQVGLRVLRCNDRQVLLELDSVVEEIFWVAREKIPLSPPLPKGEISHEFRYPSLKKRG
jgi:very-short-patch-repair endonuclease